MCFDLRDSPGPSSDDLLAGTAVPDADGLALDGVLAAERAGVPGMLGDLHLLHLLSEGGTVTVRAGLAMGSCRLGDGHRGMPSSASIVGFVCAGRWYLPGTIFTGHADLCG